MRSALTHPHCPHRLSKYPLPAAHFVDHPSPSHLSLGNHALCPPSLPLRTGDVEFTQDKQLVCRHSQCDLHTTTNILLTPLATKCTAPVSPATANTPATATCCTSDIVLAEFRTLTAKMDGANATATTVEAYTPGTPPFRIDLYSPGTLLTHAESITLLRHLGVHFTPELKAPAVATLFRGLTRDGLARALLCEPGL